MDTQPSNPSVEASGAQPIADPITGVVRWYALIGAAAWTSIGGRMGMFAYVSDNVTGPYVQQPHNHALMAYEQGWVTPAYFATFFPTEEHGMLVNHQVSRVLRPCLSQPVGRIHKSHSMRSKHHPASRAASSAHHTAPRTRTHSRHFLSPLPLTRIGQVVAPGGGTIGGDYVAPLKTAHVDANGTLRLALWSGNAALKAAQ
jgi:hypothetical protein